MTLILTRNNEMIKDGYTIKTNAVFTKGFVKGHPESSVRLTFFTGDIFEGHVKLQTNENTFETIHFEAVRSHDKNYKGGRDILDFQSNPYSWTVISYRHEDLSAEGHELHKDESICKAKYPGEKEYQFLGLNKLTKLNASEFFEIRHNKGTRSPRINIVSNDGRSSKDLIKQYEKQERAYINAKVSNAFHVDGYPNDITYRGRTECAIALVGDKTFYDKMGSHSVDYMLSVMNEIQGIYQEQMNVNLPVIYATAITNVSDPSNLGSPSDEIEGVLEQLAVATLGEAFPGNYKRVAKDVCVVHAFSNQNFDRTLGLAYIGTNTGGGICSQYGFNTGVTTILNSDRELLRSTVIEITSHELGHNFGSQHDNDYVNSTTPFPFDSNICRPLPYNYNMNAFISRNPKSFTFSPCSKYVIEQNLMYATCMDQKSQLNSPVINTNMKDAYNLTETDQCINTQHRLNNNSTSTFVECPYYQNTEFSKCLLSCATPGNSWGCNLFWSNDLNSYVPLKNGTICGRNSTNFDICYNGKCMPEFRSHVCDRSKLCCNPFGELREMSFSCGKFSGTTNPCRPTNNYCDPNSPYDKESCEFTYRKPGTPCGSCTNAEDPSTCQSSFVCGSGDSLGLCIESSNTFNNYRKCDQLNCKQSEGCVVIGDNPICIPKAIQSCKYLCSNNYFKYSFFDNDGTERPWQCDCRSDCIQRNACCSDYKNYCVLDSQNYNPINASKVLLPFKVDTISRLKPATVVPVSTRKVLRKFQLTTMVSQTVDLSGIPVQTKETISDQLSTSFDKVIKKAPQSSTAGSIDSSTLVTIVAGVMICLVLLLCCVCLLFWKIRTAKKAREQEVMKKREEEINRRRNLEKKAIEERDKRQAQEKKNSLMINPSSKVNKEEQKEAESDEILQSLEKLSQAIKANNRKSAIMRDSMVNSVLDSEFSANPTMDFSGVLRGITEETAPEPSNVERSPQGSGSRISHTQKLVDSDNGRSSKDLLNLEIALKETFDGMETSPISKNPMSSKKDNVMVKKSRNMTRSPNRSLEFSEQSSREKIHQSQSSSTDMLRTQKTKSFVRNENASMDFPVPRSSNSGDFRSMKSRDLNKSGNYDVRKSHSSNLRASQADRVALPQNVIRLEPLQVDSAKSRLSQYMKPPQSSPSIQSVKDASIQLEEKNVSNQASSSQYIDLQDVPDKIPEPEVKIVESLSFKDPSDEAVANSIHHVQSVQSGITLESFIDKYDQNDEESEGNSSKPKTAENL